MRFYVDYNQDESYTPTHIVFYAGTGNHDLIQFAEVPLNNPVGWQDVPIADCGGGPDGHSLCCWIVQIHIKENHQNGKDTHIRGIKIFALDENSAGGIGGDASRTIDNAADQSIVHSPVALNTRDPAVEELLETMDLGHSRYGVGDGNPFGSSDFMRDPEIR
jgi:anaphase-promoting complex subunit 10